MLSAAEKIAETKVRNTAFDENKGEGIADQNEEEELIEEEEVEEKEREGEGEGFEENAED